MKTTNTCGLHLQPCHSPSPPLLILHHHYHRQQPPGSWQPPLQLTSTATTTIPYNHNLLLQPVLQICRCRRWDSNAESFRTRNFNHNFDEEEDDDDTGNDDIVEQGLGVLEDYIDSIWIIKVFLSLFFCAFLIREWLFLCWNWSFQFHIKLIMFLSMDLEELFMLMVFLDVWKF